MGARDRDGDGERVHRRGFFTQGFRELFKPLAEAVEQRMEALQLDRLDPPASSGSPREGHYGYAPPYPAGLAASPAPGGRLRPPGALPEEEFLTRCGTCARCVAVCPVNAIQLVKSEDARLDRKPAIDPSRQACVVCDDLSCMKACPTGALQLVPKGSIRMGIAVLRSSTCVRTKGEDCQICVDKCPLGKAAIEILYAGAAVLVKDACTGCGVCEMYCPTDPKAIVIERRA